MYSLHRILLKEMEPEELSFGETGALLKALRLGDPLLLQEAASALRDKAGEADEDAHAEADRLERLGMDHLSTTPNLVWCLPRVWQCLLDRLRELCGGTGSRGMTKAETLLGIFAVTIASGNNCSSAMEAHHVTYAAIIQKWLKEVIKR